MKHFLLIIIWLLPSVLKAQDAKNEKLEALRIAWFSKQLELTPEEAQRFWPVYNSYQNEVQTLVRNRKVGESDEKQFKESLSNLRDKYRRDFTQAVGPQKFNRLLDAERNWRGMLQREINKRQSLNHGEMPVNRPVSPRRERDRPSAPNPPRGQHPNRN